MKRDTTLAVDTVSSLNQPLLAAWQGKHLFCHTMEAWYGILTSQSSQDILCLKLTPRFLTETPQMICTWARL